MLRLTDLMAVEPELVTADTTAAAARGLLRRRRRSHALVVEPDGTPVGLVDARCLAGAPDEAPVAGCMTGPPVTADGATGLSELLARVEVATTTVVVTEQGRSVGTVSGADVVRLAQHILPAGLTVGELLAPRPVAVREAGLPPRSGPEWIVLLRRGQPLGALSPAQVAAAEAAGLPDLAAALSRVTRLARRETPARRAAHELVRTRAEALPVVGGDGDVAVFAVADLVAAVARALGRVGAGTAVA